MASSISGAIKDLDPANNNPEIAKMLKYKRRLVKQYFFIKAHETLE